MKFSPSNTSEVFLSAKVFALSVTLFALGCTATGTTKPDAAAGAQTGADACSTAIQEAARLHNSAVDLANAGRVDPALNTFDQAIQEWQRVAAGALNCPRELVTQANDGLQKTQLERERTVNLPR
jgi:hypothetical protein